MRNTTLGYNSLAVEQFEIQCAPQVALKRSEFEDSVDFITARLKSGNPVIKNMLVESLLEVGPNWCDPMLSQNELQIIDEEKVGSGVVQAVNLFNSRKQAYREVRQDFKSDFLVPPEKLHDALICCLRKLDDDALRSNGRSILFDIRFSSALSTLESILSTLRSDQIDELDIGHMQVSIIEAIVDLHREGLFKGNNTVDSRRDYDKALDLQKAYSVRSPVPNGLVEVFKGLEEIYPATYLKDKKLDGLSGEELLDIYMDIATEMENSKWRPYSQLLQNRGGPQTLPSYEEVDPYLTVTDAPEDFDWAKTLMSIPKSILYIPKEINFIEFNKHVHKPEVYWHNLGVIDRKLEINTTDADESELRKRLISGIGRAFLQYLHAGDLLVFDNLVKAEDESKYISNRARRVDEKEPGLFSQINFIETFRLYLMSPERLRGSLPERYEYMCQLFENYDIKSQKK